MNPDRLDFYDTYNPLAEVEATPPPPSNPVAGNMPSLSDMLGRYPVSGPEGLPQALVQDLNAPRTPYAPATAQAPSYAPAAVPASSYAPAVTPAPHPVPAPQPAPAAPLLPAVTSTKPSLLMPPTAVRVMPVVAPVPAPMAITLNEPTPPVVHESVIAPAAARHPTASFSPPPVPVEPLEPWQADQAAQARSDSSKAKLTATAAVFETPLTALEGQLNRLGLTSMEREALMDAARRGASVVGALLRLAGQATLAQDLTTSEARGGERLSVVSGAGRETDLARQASRFLLSVPDDAALMNRLVEEVQKLNVLEQALPFAVGAGERLGRPRLLGRVVGLNIWWFQAVPRATRELEARLAGTWAGTASELTHLVLGRGRDPKGPALQVGDYTASAMEINIQGAVETVYLLTQVVSDGQKSLSITIPNSAEETRYRLVQGLVDGFSVIDSRGVITDVVDRATFAPLVLSRCRAVSNTASSTCPSDTEQLRMQLNTQGLSLHCGGKANEGPRWLLEPAWVTLSAGLRPVRPLEPAATPGTSEYRTWVTDQRAGARRSMQEQGVSKHRLLQMLMAGGVENVNLEDVSKLMRGRS